MSDPDLVLQWKLEILPKRRKTLPNQSILPLRIPQICNKGRPFAMFRKITQAQIWGIYNTTNRYKKARKFSFFMIFKMLKTMSASNNILKK